MTFIKTIALAGVLGLSAAPVALAQNATTLGGGEALRANGGAAGAGTAGAMPSGTAGGNAGAESGEVGSRASSAAKGNDPTGTNGATNNRF